MGLGSYHRISSRGTKLLNTQNEEVYHNIHVDLLTYI